MFQNFSDITRAAALHFKMKYVGCHVVTRTGHCSRFANAERSEDAYLQYLHTGFLGFLEGEKAITDGR